MTYFQFHLVFILPMIAALGGVLYYQGGLTRQVIRILLITCLIAFLYTTPWDNYLVYRGVWTYPTDEVIAVIGYVPVEEYAFFLLQPILSGLWTALLVRRTPEVGPLPYAPLPWPMVALGLGLFALGVAALTTPQGLYLGLILTWALPPIFLQLAVGWAELRARWPLFLLSWGAPTLYLWFADYIAIYLKIWHIDEQWSTGWKLGVLPMEEMVFFAVTNVLVVCSFLLGLRAERLAQAGMIKLPWRIEATV